MTEQGPQFPAPPGNKGKSCLTSSGEPAQPGLALECAFSYLTLVLKSLLVVLPWGLVLHVPPCLCPSLPCVHRCVPLSPLLLSPGLP